MNDTEHFRNKLMALKEQVCERLNHINKDVRHEVPADWQEQATARENDEVLDSLSHSTVQQLIRINTALQRIEVNEYFCCNICGEDIPVARLELIPFTTHCVNCAEQSEQNKLEIN